jgi:acetolactate synthase-1/2/3 large subunit
MHYIGALETLAEQVDDSMIVLGDIGSHNQWSRATLRSLHRNGFVPEGYWGAMGFGLPAAMATKLAHPERRVITVTGDGCFLMSSADFSTAVESGINPVILILNDRRYGMIVGMQEGAFGRQFATELDGPDFVAFAKAFGADGMRVERPEQMAEALERGFASKTIFVIDAICDYRSPHYSLR